MRLDGSCGLLLRLDSVKEKADHGMSVSVARDNSAVREMWIGVAGQAVEPEGGLGIKGDLGA
jgi:hypothetical protein